MEPFQKKILGWAVLVLVITGAVYLVMLTKQTYGTATTTHTVTFSGEGTVSASPDVAVIDLSIVTEAGTSKIAQDENSRKSQSVADFLKREGIEEKDIKTTGYNVYPQYTYPQTGRPIITGYQVNQSMQVKVRNLDRTNVVLDGVVAAGANQVSNLQLTIDEPERLKEEARAKAIADAKEKARTLERQLGLDLGRIVNFSESEGGWPGPFFSKAEGRDIAVGGGGPLPEIPAGENEVVVSISITWQIR